MATLVYRPGEPDERSFALGEEALTLGRGQEQDIALPHKSLSRRHARVEPSGGRYFIVDLGSKNGTFVNGARCHDGAEDGPKPRRADAPGHDGAEGGPKPRRADAPGERKELRHGDTVTLGELDLLFLIERPRAAAGRAAPPMAPPNATIPLLRSPIGKLTLEPEGDAVARTGQDATRRLRTLIEVTKLLPLSDDIDALLGKILDLVFQILDVDRGVILLVDEATGELSPRAVRPARPASDAEPIYSRHIVDYVLRRSVAALFTDAAGDPRLDASESVVVQSIRASMCAPLKPRDEVIGVLYVDSQRKASIFTEDDLEFLLAFAGQAAVALENASLYRRLERETVARMELVMEAKLTAMGGMVAAIGHELRNPLHFMSNFADASAGLAAEIEEGLAAPDGQLAPEALADLKDAASSLRENSGRIREHGRRADAILEGMVQHARRPSGRREAGDLNAVVDESIRLAREGPHGKGFEVTVVTAYDPAVGQVEMAAGEIARVLLYVVENAFYAMRQKQRAAGPFYVPELQARTAAAGDRVEVRIRDNGTGIAGEVEARMFEPFFTTKPSGQGTGLGLSLSRDIVVQGHQGTMRVETVAGEWTEMVVSLPRRAVTMGGTPRTPPVR